MGNLRPVLIIGLVFLGYMIWVQWQRDYGPAPQAAAPTGTPPGALSEPVPDVPAPADLPSADEHATVPQLSEAGLTMAPLEQH